MVRCAQALDNADSDGNLGAIGHLQLAGHEGLDLHAEVVAVGNLGRLDLQPHLHGLQVLNRLRVQGGAVKRGRAGTRGRRGGSPASKRRGAPLPRSGALQQHVEGGR